MFFAYCLFVIGGVLEVELLGANTGHDGVVDTELTSGQGTNHNATRAQAVQAELGETDLLRNAAQADNNGAFASSEASSC